MEVLQKFHALAGKGFLCEIVTDAWANWKFIHGKPIYSTAFPSGKSVCWRGVFWYFDLSGQLIHDDIGCYNIESGGAEEAFRQLLKRYELLKGEIDPDGFKKRS